MSDTYASNGASMHAHGNRLPTPKAATSKNFEDGHILSAHEKQYLQTVDPPLTVDMAVAQQGLFEKTPVDYFVRVSGAAYDSDPQRALKLAVARAARQSLQRRISSVGERVLELSERVNSTPEYTMVISASRKASSQIVKSLRVLLVAVPALVIALAVFAEQSISIYMAQNSGLGFEENRLLAFCFVFVLAALPGVCLKGIQQYLPRKLQPRFSMGMNVIGALLSIGLVACFTKVVGDAMHGTGSVWGGANHGSSIYLQMMLAMEIAGLAIILTVMIDFLQKFLKQFVTQRPRIEPERVYCEQQLKEREQELDRLNSELGIVEYAISSWKQGRRKFVNDHYVAMRTLKRSILRKQAQSMDDALTA